VFVQDPTDNVSIETDDINDGTNDVVMMTTMMIMLMITAMWRIDPLLSSDSVNSGRC
jgi:hypothetical protein